MQIISLMDIKEMLAKANWQKVVFEQLYMSILLAKDEYQEKPTHESRKDAYVDAVVAYLAYCKAMDEDFDIGDHKEIIDDFNALINNKQSARLCCALVKLSDN